MPIRTKQSYKVRGNFIAGDRSRSPPRATASWLAKSPADFTDELGRFPYSYRAVEAAVACAGKTFAAWRKTSVRARAAHVGA